jgi:hypothetical protein
LIRKQQVDYNLISYLWFYEPSCMRWNNIPCGMKIKTQDFSCVFVSLS